MYRIYSNYFTEGLEPRYCEKCRSTLEFKKLQDGYDAFTGEEKITNFLVCPKAQLNYTDHDAWKVIMNEIPALGSQPIKTF